MDGEDFLCYELYINALKNDCSVILAKVVQDIFSVILAAACDPLLFVRALATGVPLTHADAGICTDNMHSQSEALLLRTCEASSPSTWTQGVNVRVNLYDGICNIFDRCNNNGNVDSLSFKSFMHTPVGFLRNKIKC